MTPKLLSNKYEIIRRIGDGSLGTIYKARDTTLNTICALKALPTDLADRPDLDAAFQRQAAAMATLHHENIVKVFGIACDTGRYYLVEEFVEGQNLAEYLKARGRLPIAEALVISGQLAAALAYAHHHGVVHLGVAPCSILIEDKLPFRACLIDFGMATIEGASERTRAGPSLAKLKYRAPEQMGYRSAEGRIVADARADIYALGMLIFEMCEGEPFFAGLTPQEIVRRVVSGREPLIPEFSGLVPQAVTALVTHAVCRDPAERYQCMDDFLHDLEECTDSLAETNDSPTVVLPIPSLTEPPPDNADDHEADERTRVLHVEQLMRAASHSPALEKPNRDDELITRIVRQAERKPDVEPAEVVAPPDRTIGSRDRPIESPSAEEQTRISRREISAKDQTDTFGLARVPVPEIQVSRARAPHAVPRGARQRRQHPPLGAYVTGAALAACIGLVGAWYAFRPSPQEVETNRPLEVHPAWERVEPPFEVDRDRLAPHQGGPSDYERKHINRPPQIESALPTGESVSLVAGPAQQFSVVARYPDLVAGDALTFTWERNGQVVYSGTRSSWTLYDPKENDREVRVTVTIEGDSGTASRNWRLAVIKAFAPPGRPPRIAAHEPTGDRVTVDEGSSVVFGVQAEAPSGNGAVTYAWFFDRREVGHAATWQLIGPVATAPSTRHTVEVEVADSAGLRAPRVRWSVEVRAVAPKIVDFTPRTLAVSVAAGDSPLFFVTTKVQGDQKELLHEWTIDSGLTHVTREARFRLPPSLPVGVHDIRVAVVDTRGVRSAPHRWTVEIAGRRTALP